MKKIPDNYFKGIICSICALFLSALTNAQHCSPEMLAAKYWQYRENLNKHFLLINRDSAGCVGDGIGQQGAGSCVFSKAGYSLPATSINMAQNGGDQGGYKSREDGIWQNTPCADAGPSPGVSEDNAKHNYLDMGSETPHQMGWYWVVLATEYELLRRNGQYEEARRTLEELFLGLQAYRRLDMQAQCMVQRRYAEITENFEVEPCGNWYCLCGEKYRKGGHKHFDSPCFLDCDFTPQLDGYSGFFLREDATQGLEILHDPCSSKSWTLKLYPADFVRIFIRSQAPSFHARFGRQSPPDIGSKSKTSTSRPAGFPPRMPV